MSDDTNATKERKSLEYWLNRATDPDADPATASNYIKSFCDQLNEELEGPQIACRLLAHKIQSPQEQESLHALAVTEACVRNCGQRFHNELGKFRFLNELIKILSPKYLGSKTSERVRQRTIELMYSWSQGLKHLTKLRQAYEMLKQQGVITHDPTYMDEIYEPPVASLKPRTATFEDDEKAKLLAALLKSPNPDDLVAANRLIKSMVKEDERKQEKLAKRAVDLKTMENNARLLCEMLGQYNRSSVTEQELEIMKELLESLQSQRPSLFRYATEANENEESSLAEILSINDDVGRAIDDYQAKVLVNPPASSTLGTLLSLEEPLDFLTARGSNDAITPDRSSDLSAVSDDVLLLGGFGTPLIQRRGPETFSGRQTAYNDLSDVFGSDFSAQQQRDFPNLQIPQSASNGNRNSSSSTGSSRRDSGANPGPGKNSEDRKGSGGDLTGAYLAATQSSTQAQPKNVPKPKGLLDLDVLSQAMIQERLPTGKASSSQFVKECKPKVSLKDIPSTYIPPPSLSPLDPFGPKIPATTTGAPLISVDDLVSPYDDSNASTSRSAAVASLPRGGKTQSNERLAKDLIVSLKDLQDRNGDEYRDVVGNSDVNSTALVSDKMPSSARASGNFARGTAGGVGLSSMNNNYDVLRIDHASRHASTSSVPRTPTSTPNFRSGTGSPEIGKERSGFVMPSTAVNSINRSLISQPPGLTTSENAEISDRSMKCGSSNFGTVQSASNNFSPTHHQHQHQLHSLPDSGVLRNSDLSNKSHSPADAIGNARIIGGGENKWINSSKGAGLDHQTSSSVDSEASTMENDDRIPVSLDDVDLELADIEPADKEPVVAVNQDRIQILVHYAGNQPKPFVVPTVVSIVSKHKHKLTDVLFDVRVDGSKGFVAKLLEPTSTVLAGFNPIFPQTAISQVLLIALCPSLTELQIEVPYTLTFVLDGSAKTVQGNICLDVS